MTNLKCIRVLSVDDHPLFREGVGTIINCQADMSLAGTASNGREGIEAFRALRPDVTLMDLRLPDLSGLELQRELDAMLPIIFVSGHGDIPMSVSAMKAGATDFLSKPVCDTALLRAIGQALVIAVVKATLVILFFMHVWHSTRLTWVVVGGGLFWLGILLALTLSDYLTRPWQTFG